MTIYSLFLKQTKWPHKLNIKILTLKQAKNADKLNNDNDEPQQEHSELGTLNNKFAE